MPELVLEPEVVERFRRLGVALAIGLLIGIERGWKDREGPEGARTAGVRTFSLIGLLGGVVSLIAAELGGVVLALAFLGAAGGMTVFEIHHARRVKTSDATTLIAAMLVFGLGAMAGLGYFHAAAAAAVAAALILALKESLHGWLERITFEELRAGLALAAMTVIVLPLLPSAPVDPWGAVSLRAVWLLTVLIAAISFIGYAAIRIAGPERGPLVAGLAGGLVSSTATVLSFARMAKRRRRGAPPLIAGGVIANAVMFARVGLVAGVLRPELAAPLAAGLAPAAIASAVAAAWLIRRPLEPDTPEINGGGAVLSLKNPLAIGTALTFGLLLAAVTLAAAALEAWIGARGVYVLAAVSGLADVDAITLSMTQSMGTAAHAAALAIMIAVAVNTVAKAVMARVVGGTRVGIVMLVTSSIALVAGATGFFTYMGFAAISGAD
jgi:uncharacterized membrane protein (DUF4010 family)